MGKLKYPLGILLTIIIGMLLNMLWCCNCWGNDNAIDNDKTTPVVIEQTEEIKNVGTTASAVSYLILKDQDGNLIEEATNHLNFNISDYKHLEPIEADVVKSYGKIKTYLDKHPDQKFNITGLYSSEEKNNSAFINLGEARANDVKNYLSSLGYDTTHMGIKGKLSDQLVTRNGVVYGPVNYHLSDFPSGKSAVLLENELDNLAADIRANPLVLHFATGASTINLSTEQREKISKMVHYLDARPQSSLISVGHTDNTGSRSTNTTISAKRAEFAKSYLVKNGINSSRIESSGKGPDEPIATNDTEEGKEQNRRVVVTLK
ncbi:OmpA family protein [Nonlabens sp. Asnod3-H03]|uniref:Outer membrane protein A n=1 Tax=Nonlabens ulvanivorans TaxID=906888 RepID=A0A081D7W1_NONUL|nr:OmpA family protein [Nonlabens ulvanivorans]GAK75007.1 outer membrane protein A precursor [Nonlabens ulvanivorans]